MKSKIVKLKLADGTVKYVGMLKTGWFTWAYLNGVFEHSNRYFTFDSLDYIDSDHRFNTVKEAQDNINKALKIYNTKTIIAIEDVKPE